MSVEVELAGVSAADRRHESIACYAGARLSWIEASGLGALRRMHGGLAVGKADAPDVQIAWRYAANQRCDRARGMIGRALRDTPSFRDDETTRGRVSSRFAAMSPQSRGIDRSDRWLRA